MLLFFHTVIVLLEVEGTSFPSASQQLTSLGREQSVMHKSRKDQLVPDISATDSSVCVLRVQEDSAPEHTFPVEHGPCCLLVSKRQGWAPRRSQCFHTPLVQALLPMVCI